MGYPKQGTDESLQEKIDNFEKNLILKGVKRLNTNKVVLLETTTGSRSPSYSGLPLQRGL